MIPRVKYDLHSLGWKAFQELCLAVLGEVWGQTVQGFLDAHDGGRDGAFHGSWRPQSGEAFRGSFTVQCKFSASADKHLRIADVSDEFKKAAILAKRGLATNYILMTSAKVSGSTDDKLRAAFLAIDGIANFATFGAERISQFIAESSRLRMMLPRVYGLGDLTQILDERAYSQALAILNALGDDFAKFVVTDAYRKSARAISEHGFVLLLGEPASGKSTIAGALALAAIDQWGCSTVK